MDITALLITAGIPSAFTGLAVWLLQRQITKTEIKRQKQQEQREKERQEMMLCILDSVNASIGLAEATAKALERTPSIDCNGDMHNALEHAQKEKRKQKEFLKTLGVMRIYEND